MTIRRSHMLRKAISLIDSRIARHGDSGKAREWRSTCALTDLDVVSSLICLPKPYVYVTIWQTISLIMLTFFRTFGILVV